MTPTPTPSPGLHYHVHVPGWMQAVLHFIQWMLGLAAAPARLAVSIAVAVVGGWLNFTLICLMLFGTAALFYARFLSGAAIKRNRVRALRWRIRCYLKPADGFASFGELIAHWSRLAAWFHARRGRPDLNWVQRLLWPTDDIAVRYGRTQYGKRVFGRFEDNVGKFALPRTGKTADLADRIMRHPGAAIVSSARGDLYLATVNRRMYRKPSVPWFLRFFVPRDWYAVHVFNPQGFSGVRSTFTWDLLGCCGDMESAMRMANWLTGENASSNLQWFEEKGTVALGGLLLAAATCNGQAGRPLYTLRDVFMWVHSGKPGNCSAIPILNHLGHTEAGMLVTRLLGADRTAGSVRDTIDKSLQWTVIPELADAVGRTGDLFDLRRMLFAGETVYLINSGDEDSLITPVIRSLASWLHYETIQIASRQPGQRLPVPLLMALDEVPNTCPVDLPGILSTAGGWGICVEWIAHSIAQLRKTWGDEGAETILDTSGVLAILPGIKADAALESLSRLCGVRPGEDNEGQLGARLIPPALIRELPDWRALLIRTNRPILVVRFRPYFKRVTFRWPWKMFTRLGPVQPSRMLRDFIPFDLSAHLPEDDYDGALVPAVVYGTGDGPDDDETARPPSWPKVEPRSSSRPPRWTPDATPPRDTSGGS